MKSLYSRSIVAGIIGGITNFLLMLLALYAMSGYLSGGSSDSGGMFIIILRFIGAILGIGLVGLATAHLVAKEARGLGDTIIASVISGIIAMSLIMFIIVLAFFIQGLAQNGVYNALSMLPWLILGGGYFLVMALPFAIASSIMGAIVYRLFFVNVRISRLTGIVINKWPGISALVCGLLALGLPVAAYLYATAGSPGMDLVALLVFFPLAMVAGIISIWPLRHGTSTGNVSFTAMFAGSMAGLAWSVGSFAVTLLKNGFYFWDMFFISLDMIAGGILFGFVGAMIFRAIANYRPKIKANAIPVERSFYASALRIGFIIGAVMLLLMVVPALISLAAARANPSGATSMPVILGASFGCIAIQG